ncbi:MAG: O-antigen ligase family protein [Rhizobiaceae bacterium]|nr:O-antigen ligase family protein [Rhizobiaceae bacterium]
MNARPYVIALGTRWAGFVGLAAGAAAILAAGPLKGLMALIGLVVVVVSVADPMIGLVGVMFANTSLQVIGSSHIIGLPASLSKIYGAIALAAVVAHVLFAGWRPTSSPIYRPILLFVILVVAWDLVVQYPETEFLEGTGRLLLTILLTALVATIAGQSQRRLDLAVLALSAAMALTGIIGLMEHFLPSLAIESDDPRLALGTLGGVIDSESLDGVIIKRISGGIGDANWLSYSIAMSLPLLLYAWHRWTGFWMRSLLAAFGALQMIALTLSYTRTGFLGLGVAVVYLLLRGVLPLRPMLAAAVAAMVGLLIYLPPGFVDRMFSQRYLSEGSTPLRALFVRQATEIWLTNPLFGHGYKGFGFQFHDAMREKLPDDIRLHAWAEDMEQAVLEGRELISNIGAHNLELEILVEYGLVGFVLFAAIFVASFRELWRTEKTGPPHLQLLAITIEAGLIAFLVCSLFGHTKYLKFLWLLFGLVMAARRVSSAGDSGVRTLLESRGRE